MARSFLEILLVFVGSAVYALADEQQEYVEQDFRTSDAFNDPRYSSTIAAHEGYRLFTNIPGQGLTESLTLTHRDGLYVAGEKVVTETEHRRVVGELRVELQSTRDKLQATRDELRTELDETKSEVLALVRALQEVSPANNSLILQPPTCEEPGGDKLHYNGTHWECICEVGYSGDSCETTQAAYIGKGFCAVTGYYECGSGGSWGSARYAMDGHTRITTTHDCIQMCLECAACNYISVEYEAEYVLDTNRLASLEDSIIHCDWYSTCSNEEAILSSVVDAPGTFNGTGGYPNRNFVTFKFP